MRLAHFIQRYPPALGGSEAYFQRLSRYLVAQGDTVHVCTTTADEVSAFWSPHSAVFSNEQFADAGVQVRRYPLWRMRGRRWLLKPLSLIPLRAWQALTLPCNPISMEMWRDAGRAALVVDAVHATAFPYAWPIMCAQRLARRLDVPFLLTPFLHLGDAEDQTNPTRRQYTQPALRRLLLNADRVFVQTEPEREAALDLGVYPDKIVLQGLGVDSAECTGGDRDRVRSDWGVQANDVVVGHLANLSVEKGTVDLMKAMTSITEMMSPDPPLTPPFQGGESNQSPCLPGRGREGCERNPIVDRIDNPECRSPVLVLAGPSMPNYRDFRQLYPFGGIIELGRLTEPQKRDFFAGIDMFVLPSRSDSYGLVLLEAWANGKPAIAYRAGGPAALIRPGIDGHLVRCGDTEELADRIVELANDPEQRQRLGQAGRRRVTDEFQWGDKLRLVRCVIEDCINERRGIGSLNQAPTPRRLSIP